MLKRKSKDDAPVTTAEFDAVPVQVFSKSGWIIGKVHIQSGWNLMSLFENSKEYISLTEVILEGRPKVIPVFTLHRSAILFLKPERELNQSHVADSRNRVVHPVSFLLTNGSLYGMAEVTKGVRLAAYLSRQTGFLLVQNCHYRLHNPWERRILDHTEPVLLLNPSAIIGFSEWVKDEE